MLEDTAQGPYTRRDNSHGFTLIEAVIVFVLISIISVILIPQISGTKGAPYDLTAQQADSEAVAAEVRMYETTGAFADPTVGAQLTALEAQEPTVSIVVGTTASTGPTTVSVGYSSSSGSVISVAALGSNGQCWYQVRTFGGSTSTRSDVYGFSLDQPCTAAEAVTGLAGAGSAGTSWSSPYHIP